MNRRSFNSLFKRLKRFRMAATALFTVLGLAACATLPPPEASPEHPVLGREEMDRDFMEDRNWWRGYGDPLLNRYLETALERNTDLAQSALRIHRALMQARLAGADIFPTAYGDGGVSARRELRNGRVSHNYQTDLGLSYELDLWGRLRDNVAARKWEHEATIADRDTVRLALIHSVINSYSNLRYLREAQSLTRDSIARYQKLFSLVQIKVSLGKVAPVEAQQAERSLLTAQNQLRTLLAEEAGVVQTLADLLNCPAKDLPPIASTALLDQKNIPVDLEVPIAALGARPDLQAAQMRFASAFYSLQSAQASWYPTVTLGGAFGTSATSSGQAFKFPFLAGNAGLNLPFLDWARVRANVKIAEDDYELARLDFETAVTGALNEVWAAYRTSEESRRSLVLLRQRLEREKAITAHYEARYTLGAGELKDYLEALNTEDATRQSVVQAKYALLRDESTVYRAMGGRFLVKKRS